MNQEITILDTLNKYIADQDAFPVLNPDAVKIHQEIVKSDPDLGAVKKLIQTDPTLTSELLKTANSPFYKGLGEISTIKDAALRMGQEELFSIIIKIIHKQNFSSANPMIKKRQSRLWDHSVACAYGSRWVAKHLKLDELLPMAFIAGLLHDMGKLCLLSALEKMVVANDSGITLTPSLVEKILDSLHAEQGYALLMRWNLPSHYCCIARDHHAQDYDVSDLLLVVVRLVNMVCEKMDRGDPDEDLSYIMGAKEADFLGIKETGIALLEIALEDTRLA